MDVDRYVIGMCPRKLYGGLDSSRTSVVARQSLSRCFPIQFSSFTYSRSTGKHRRCRVTAMVPRLVMDIVRLTSSASTRALNPAFPPPLPLAASTMYPKLGGAIASSALSHTAPVWLVDQLAVSLSRTPWMGRFLRKRMIARVSRSLRRPATRIGRVLRMRRRSCTSRRRLRSTRSRATSNGQSARTV